MDALFVQSVWYALETGLLWSHYYHVDSPAPGRSDNRLWVCCSTDTKFSLVVFADLVYSGIPMACWSSSTVMNDTLSAPTLFASSFSSRLPEISSSLGGISTP